MRRVVVESPYAGDAEGNGRYLDAALLDCYCRGEAPIASHAIGPRCLDDADAGQRSVGMRAGWEWINVADALVVYIDRGVSTGMDGAIAVARSAGVPIEYRSIRQ